MSPEDREPTDQEFEAFMAGSDPVSREYQRAEKTAAPADLDTAVLRMARAAVAAPRPRPEPAVTPRPRRRWQVPMALAATLLLSLTSLVLLQEDKTPGGYANPDIAAPQITQESPAAAAAPASMAVESERPLLDAIEATPAHEPPPPPPAPAKPKPLSPPEARIAAPAPKPEPMPPPAAPSVAAAALASSNAQGHGGLAPQEAKQKDMASLRAQEQRRQEAIASSAAAGAMAQRMDEVVVTPQKRAARSADADSDGVVNEVDQPSGGRLDSDHDGVPDYFDDAEAAAAAKSAAAAKVFPVKPSPPSAEEWIALIRKLRDQPNLPEARRELENFRRTFPAYALPEDLKPLLPQPDAPPK